LSFTTNEPNMPIYRSFYASWTTEIVSATSTTQNCIQRQLTTIALLKQRQNTIFDGIVVFSH
jgi:hypothetical protein